MRKLGDSNPRYGNPYGSLANCWFQPLTQTSLPRNYRAFALKCGAKVMPFFHSSKFFEVFFFAFTTFFFFFVIFATFMALPSPVQHHGIAAIQHRGIATRACLHYFISRFSSSVQSLRFDRPLSGPSNIRAASASCFSCHPCADNAECRGGARWKGCTYLETGRTA